MTDTPSGFTGYSSVFWVTDSYGTAFAEGAFSRALAERNDYPVLWQHDSDSPVGRHDNIKEDGTGLRIDVGLSSDGGEGSMAAARLRDRVPLGLSFGFRTRKDRAAADDDPLNVASFEALGLRRSDVRVITSVDFYESSLVTFPACRAARVVSLRHRQPARAITEAIGIPNATRSTRPRRNVTAEFDLLFLGSGIPTPAPLHALPPPPRKETIVALPDLSFTPQHPAVRSAHGGGGNRSQAPAYDHRSLSTANVVSRVVAPHAPRVLPPAGFCGFCGEQRLQRESDVMCSECKREAQRAIAAEEQQG